jgi:hypothetical protein
VAATSKKPRKKDIMSREEVKVDEEKGYRSRPKELQNEE